MNEQVGRYKILGKLGKGAMGVVYLAEDPKLNRRVAIKTVELAADDTRNSDFLRERLVRDGRAAASLSHPNIVSVYDVLEEGDIGYLVMEYIAGESLAARLARDRRPDTPFIARVLREMASALDYTHARGIIHRDIKPANVMLAADSGGSAKIMDFGIARITDTRTSTPTGMVMGTLQYMAPEQINGDPVDGRSDQFSLAAVAYEMLTGNTLFGEQKFATLAYKIMNEMPVPPRTYNPGLPEGVDEVVARALRKPPAERYQTCGGFVSALERAFAGEVPPTGQLTQAMLVRPDAESSVPTVPMPAPATSVPAASKMPLIAGIASLVVAIVLVAGLFIFKPWAPQPASPTEHAAVPSTPQQSAATPEPAQKQPAPAAHPPEPPTPSPIEAAAKKTPTEPADDAGPDSTPSSEPDPSEGALPQPARAAYHEGESLEKSDRYPAAIEKFSRAIELRPDFVRAYFARGAAYLHVGRPADAFADYAAILSKNPRNAVAISQRGICHYRLHDEAAAMADFDHALAIRSNLPGAFNGRGLIYYHRNQYPKALHEFSEAIRVSPDFSWAYINRARTEEATGNLSAAQADRKKAQQLGLVVQ